MANAFSLSLLDWPQHVRLVQGPGTGACHAAIKNSRMDLVAGL